MANGSSAPPSHCFYRLYTPLALDVCRVLNGNYAAPVEHPRSVCCCCIVDLYVVLTEVELIQKYVTLHTDKRVVQIHDFAAEDEEERTSRYVNE